MKILPSAALSDLQVFEGISGANTGSHARRSTWRPGQPGERHGVRAGSVRNLALPKRITAALPVQLGLLR